MIIINKNGYYGYMKQMNMKHICNLKEINNNLYKYINK